MKCELRRDTITLRPETEQEEDFLVNALGLSPSGRSGLSVTGGGASSGRRYATLGPERAPKGSAETVTLPECDEIVDAQVLRIFASEELPELVWRQLWELERICGTEYNFWIQRQAGGSPP